MTEGLNQTIKKFLCYLFNPSPLELRSFGLSPIFPYGNTGEKCTMLSLYRNWNAAFNTPLPCPVALRGVLRSKYRGSARRARGLIQAKAQSPIPPLSGGEDARETEGKGRGLSEQSEFRSPRRRDRSDKPISSTTTAALLGSSFSLLRRMNK